MDKISGDVPQWFSAYMSMYMRSLPVNVRTILSSAKHCHNFASFELPMAIIPDLTYYAQGLDPSTFPLKVDTTSGTDSDALSVVFTIVTLEHYTGHITLDGQGFKVISIALDFPKQPSQPPFSQRQQEAFSGKVYETIEALLMALSPAFEEFFGRELAKKLEAVSWDRFQRQQEDTDTDGDDNRD